MVPNNGVLPQSWMGCKSNFRAMQEPVPTTSDIFRNGKLHISWCAWKSDHVCRWSYKSIIHIPFAAPPHPHQTTDSPTLGFTIPHLYRRTHIPNLSLHQLGFTKFRFTKIVFFSIVRYASTQGRMPAHRGMASQNLQTFERC